MKLKFYGRAYHGKIVYNTPSSVEKYIQSLEGKGVEVSIGREQKTRSGKQNRYYWSVCVHIISEFTGYNKLETHELMKSLFLKEYKRIGNQETPIIKSTTELTTIEFEEYIEQVKQWAATDLNIVIPDVESVDI